MGYSCCTTTISRQAQSPRPLSYIIRDMLAWLDIVLVGSPRFPKKPGSTFLKFLGWLGLTLLCLTPSSPSPSQGITSIPPFPIPIMTCSELERNIRASYSSPLCSWYESSHLNDQHVIAVKCAQELTEYWVINPHDITPAKGFCRLADSICYEAGVAYNVTHIREIGGYGLCQI